MKNLLLAISLFLFLFNGCKPSNRRNNPENLKEVLIDYFGGIKTKNYQKMKDLTTSDFVLYEDGKIWNNDSLIHLVKNSPKFTAEYTFKDFKITVDDSTGSMYYSNHGAFIFNDTSHVNFDWLESASFKKINDHWKIAFLHSTTKKK